MKAFGVCFLALLVLGEVHRCDAQTCNTSLAAEVAATPQLSQLSAIVILAGLGELFSDPTLNVTVFAPNNAAIQGLARSLNDSGLTVSNLTGTNNNRAASIILYHVLNSSHSAAELLHEQTYPTLYKGATLQVDKNATTVEIEAADSDAVVVTPDIPVCNSWVHIINDVLLPEDLDNLEDIEPYPFATTPSPSGTPPAPDSGATTIGTSSLMAALVAIAAVVATL